MKLKSILFIAFVGLVLSSVSGLSPLATTAGIAALSFLSYQYRHQLPFGALFFTLADIGHTQGQANMGGLVRKIYYAPIDDILTFPELAVAGGVKTDVGSNFVMKTNKEFVQIYFTDGTGKFDDTTVGERDGRSKENMLEFFHPGNKEAILAFERFALNTPCVVIAVDSEGQQILFGAVNLDDSTTDLTGDCPAYLESSNGTSGAARADKRGKTFQFKASATHGPIIYVGTIPLTPAS